MTHRRDLSGVAGTPNAEVFIFGVLAVAAVVVDAGASAGTTALTTASAAFSAATTLSGRTRADGCKKQSLLRINKHAAHPCIRWPEETAGFHVARVRSVKDQKPSGS